NGNGTGLALEAFDGSLIVADVQRNTAAGSTDLGEDSNRNGILDAGEDTNGNGNLDFGSGFRFFANDSTITLNTFIENSATGGAGNGATFQTLNDGSINVANTVIDPDTMEPATA